MLFVQGVKETLVFISLLVTGAEILFSGITTNSGPPAKVIGPGPPPSERTSRKSKFNRIEC